MHTQMHTHTHTHTHTHIHTHTHYTCQTHPIPGSILTMTNRKKFLRRYPTYTQTPYTHPADTVSPLPLNVNELERARYSHNVRSYKNISHNKAEQVQYRRCVLLAWHLASHGSWGWSQNWCWTRCPSRWTSQCQFHLITKIHDSILCTPPKKERHEIHSGAEICCQF